MFLHRDEQTDRQADKDRIKYDKWMYRQTEKDRRLCGWVSGRSTDGRTERRKDRRMDGQTDINRHKDRNKDRGSIRQMDRQEYVCKTGGLMDEWTNRQSDGQMVKLTELLTEILAYLHRHRQIKREIENGRRRVKGMKELKALADRRTD
jgi:hypothetical protein